MELQIDIEINQLLGLIRQMPSEHKLLIRKELDGQHNSVVSKSIDEGLTELLLSGPVMTEEENENFKMAKKYFERIDGLELV
ncbi:MAG: hypothetical protein B6I19_06750 [Bacteroidetes bacterium 4572_114]|nr:MAG: hypothetical protein B6I19_06750 [Bacteroidetes bacterium 4572_114]